MRSHVGRSRRPDRSRPERRRPARHLLAISVVAVLASTSPAATAAVESGRPGWLDVSVFTPVGAPGHPEGVVAGSDGTVYFGTHMDGDGLIYAMDRDPSRVITIDPDMGEQRDYATFADVPPCSTGAPAGACSATVGDRPVMADDPVFGPDGSLYVTDIYQALIWRIPPGGGAAEVWFTAPELESIFGPNGIRFIDNGRTLMFAQSAHNLTDPADIPTAQGRLYTLRVRADGTPGPLNLFWQGQPGEGLDGFAVGASGKIYAAMALPGALLALARWQ